MTRIEIKKEIVRLWESIGSSKVDNFITDFLDNPDKSDFFEAPCSTEYHLCRPGGLAEHSLNVYSLLEEKVERYGLNIARETVIICGLGHDLCKCNFYTKGKKNVKENGRWIEKEVYLVKDEFPFGHGEKSVSILQDYITLTEEEKLAIRFHMNAFDPATHFYTMQKTFYGATQKTPLVTLLFTADYEASQILEAQ